MSSPATPQRASSLPQSPSLTALRRVHTLPTRLIDPTRTPPQVNHAADAIETLLNLDFAKVVAFDAATPGSRPNSRPSSSAGPTTLDSTQEDVPWTTPSERTLAAGPLKIYRVPNTGVSFLNSGSFLKPILQRSQCWCVDDGAKFVLRVRQASYYRIELPCSTPEEKHQVEELKQTLDQLCRYEKTPCPFKKGYFELEERPLTPVRKPSLATREKAKKWRLNKVWEPEDADRRAEFEQRNRRASEQWNTISLKPTKRPDRPTRIGTEPIFIFPRTPPRKIHSFAAETPSPLSYAQETELEHIDSDYSSVDQLDGLADLKSSRSNSPSNPSSTSEFNIEQLEPPLHYDNHSAEVQTSCLDTTNDSTERISVRSESPACTEEQSTVEDSHSDPAPAPSLTANAETASINSSRDSFYSVEDFQGIEDTNDFQPTMLKPQLSIFKTSLHSRDSSIATTVPDTPRAFLIPPRMCQEPTTPTLTASSSSSESTNEELLAVTPPQTLRQRRPMASLEIEDDELSQLPRRLSIFAPAATIGVPLGKAVIQKTYAILMGPPTHLVTVMLSIAARILRRLPRHHRRRIPGAWDTNDSDDDDEGSDWDEADTEDDYGYPLRTINRFEDAKEEPSPVAPMNVVDTGGPENESWEID